MCGTVRGNINIIITIIARGWLDFLNPSGPQSKLQLPLRGLSRISLNPHPSDSFALSFSIPVFSSGNTGGSISILPGLNEYNINMQIYSLRELHAWNSLDLFFNI